MKSLTADQVNILNNINFNTRRMAFGDKCQQLISVVQRQTTPGTPVNAVNAKETLTVSGVVVHGETVSIDNPAVEGVDVYEFLADAAQTKTALTNIAVDITAYVTQSTIPLTIDTQPTSGDKMTIGEKVYTFVPVGTATADGEISIGEDLAGAQAAIVAAINGTDGINEPHPLVRAGAFAENASAITALIGGAAGDLIATTSEFTTVTNGFADVTLGSGADCSAANAITALVGAFTDSDTQGVGAADGTGDTVVLTADVAGTIGNTIVIGETMEKGSFTEDAEALSGGVNGTVGLVDDAMVDASYLYRCIATNTTAGKNWRRISLGNVYQEGDAS